MYITGHGADTTTWSKARPVCMSLAVLTCQHCQMTTALSGNNLQLPGSKTDVLKAWAFLENPTQVMQPDCFGMVSFEDTLAIRFSGPAALVIVGALLFLASIVVSKATHRGRMDFNTLFNAVFSLVFTLFPAIVAVSLVTFKCHTNPNGKDTLVADEGILCSGDPWTGMAVGAVFASVIYVGGFGAVMTWAIIKAPKHYSRAEFRARWKFLFLKYSEECWWWSLPFLAKIVLMNMGQCFFEQGVSQVLWVCLVASVYQISVAIFNPWRHQFLSWFDIGMNTIFILFCTEVLWLSENYSSDNADSDLARNIATAGTVVNLLLLPIAVGIAAWLMYDEHKNSLMPRLEDGAKFYNLVQTVSKATEQELVDFFKDLSALDLANIRSTMQVVNAEFLGQLSKKCCTSRSISRTSTTAVKEAALSDCKVEVDASVKASDAVLASV
mmetsp:Transcript_42487/g.133982  ORF Transcript_42487/g.133982 Transcript_42487/m.133982 type:complete len:440 (-) Transcript_42487:71-1390(-)